MIRNITNQSMNNFGLLYFPLYPVWILEYRKHKLLTLWIFLVIYF